MKDNQSNISLADDILRGCASIAKFIGEDERRTFTLLQEGVLPAQKERNIWVSTKSALKAHYNPPQPGSTAA
jgi:hypothetical protein